MNTIQSRYDEINAIVSKGQYHEATADRLLNEIDWHLEKIMRLTALKRNDELVRLMNTMLDSALVKASGDTPTTADLRMAAEENGA